ncbi:MAG TPA: hypothetical protein VN811_00135, partial [Thermoanaerobaculia bacterium]|nr:hypothetical protein [Thermoanaerobaculia bacterium]
ARLVSKIESVDLDPGKEATTLTWNVTPQIDLKAAVWREPAIFAPLKKALGSDTARIESLSGGISEGDDWEISVAGQWGKKGGDTGTGTAYGLAGHYKSVLRQACLGLQAPAMERRISPVQLAALPEEAIADAGRQMRDAEHSTWELSLRAFSRDRTVEVGPNSQGAKLKFIYGIPSKAAAKAAQNRATLLGDPNGPLQEDVAQRVAAALTPYLDQIDPEHSAAADALTSQDQSRSLADRGQAKNRELLRAFLRDEGKAVPATQSAAFELEWKQTDDYLFPSTGSPVLTLPEEESLVIKASYSVELKADALADTARPRYELSGSYEDVDGDAKRQSRLLLALKASARVEALGKDSDVTFGLHWANKPEYLELGEDDRGITARLALTFKLGAPPK